MLPPRLLFFDYTAKIVIILICWYIHQQKKSYYIAYLT
nr:MAG TPA_asm: hypothetical protein [Caudoviricetes sp.]